MFRRSHPATLRCAAHRPHRIALLLPAAVLGAAITAAPAHADPPGPHPGRSGDTPARTGSVPAPAHAAAHEHAQPGRHGSAGDAPQGPPAGEPAEGAPAPDGPPVLPDADTAQRVVICKYVRKPGEAEVFSHIIVVNENALLGNGFAGTFPFPFSDAHFNSVAIRYAATGEQASEISAASCESAVPLEEPPTDDTVPEVTVPDAPEPEVAGIVVTNPDLAAGSGLAVRTEQAARDEDALPQTGAPAHGLLLALLGGIATLGGVWLVGRGRRGHLPSA